MHTWSTMFFESESDSSRFYKLSLLYKNIVKHMGYLPLERIGFLRFSYIYFNIEFLNFSRSININEDFRYFREIAFNLPFNSLTCHASA